MYSALLNGGKFPSPKLIKNEPSKYLGEELNPNDQKAILNALKAAVQEPSGTAYKLNLDNPNFVKIGGKTGTSQVVRIKEEDREDDLYKTKEIEDRFKDHSVFVGYAPIEEPKPAASQQKRRAFRSFLLYDDSGSAKVFSKTHRSGTKARKPNHCVPNPGALSPMRIPDAGIAHHGLILK